MEYKKEHTRCAMESYPQYLIRNVIKTIFCAHWTPQTAATATEEVPLSPSPKILSAQSPRFVFMFLSISMALWHGYSM